MSYALITGASKGIGKAIAEELAKRGYSVLLVARSEKALQELSARLKEQYKVDAQYLSLDLTSAGAAKKIFDWCEENKFDLRVLVNNAGYGLSGPFEQYKLTDYLDMMQLNMSVPVELCHLFLPKLRQQNASHILNIGSTAGYQAIPNLSVYAASKAFVISFSRGLSHEVKGSNVSVSCISPGATDTDFVVRAKIGQKGLNAAKKVNMTTGAVAKIAIDAMLAGKREVITGIINKLGRFLVWIAPKGVVERTTMKIYE